MNAAQKTFRQIVLSSIPKQTKHLMEDLINEEAWLVMVESRNDFSHEYPWLRTFH